MKKIAIVKTSSIGDIAHTAHIPFLIKKHITECEIHWYCDKTFVEILENHKYIDKIIPVNSKGVNWKVWRFFKHLQFLKKEYSKEQYDVVIDFQGTWKSALIAKSICRNGELWGLGKTRDFLAKKLYPNRLFCSMFENVYHRAVKLMNEALDVNAKMNEVRTPFLWAEKNIRGGVLVFPSSSKANKNYSIDGFAEIISGISSKVTLLYGSKDEKTVCDSIAGKTNKHVDVVGGLSLSEVKNLIASVDVVIAGDTGISHMATALGVKNIILYGATSAYRTTLFGENSRTLQGNGASWKIPPQNVLKELTNLGL